MESITLSDDELVTLTGYKVAAKQLRELQRAGFTRARIGSTGRVVLERDHYRAVCAGQAQAQTERPRVRPALRAA